MPNLTRQRATLERQMTDLIKVTRDPQGTRDGELNKITLQVEADPADSSKVYRGKALVLYKTATGASTTEGGEDVYRDYVRVRVPVTAGPFEIGDVVEVLHCPGDPQLVGKQLTVDTVPCSTIAVSRILRCTIRTRGART